MNNARNRARPQRKVLVAALAACLALASSTATLPTLAAATHGVAEHRPFAKSTADAQRRRQLFSPQATPHNITRSTRTAASGRMLDVDTCADDGSAGSLRTLAEAAVDGDTIDLTSLSCSTITLENGQIAIAADNLQIDGPGSAALTIDGAGNGRIFAHEGEGELAIAGVSIVNGVLSNGDDYAGGCVLSYGDVALNDVVITGCRIINSGLGIGAGVRAIGRVSAIDSVVSDNEIVVYGAAGGAAITSEEEMVLVDSRITGNTVEVTGNYDYGYIYFGAVSARGRLTMTASTISGNRSFLTDPETSYAFVYGGGVTLHSGGVIAGSTIDHNQTRDLGGGVHMLGREGLEIVSSTISSNTAQWGGGVLVAPLANFVAIRSSTIAGNVAGTGGGIYFAEDLHPLTFELQNTIIANNIAEVGGDLAKFNRLATYGASNLVVDVQPGLPLPADTLRVDPHLMPLADNGGPTWTHALAPSSPAIDAGNDYFEAGTDQRGLGFARVSGDEADIGAFEVQQPPPPSAAPDRIFAHGMEDAP